jgi:hypothetical protein
MRSILIAVCLFLVVALAVPVNSEAGPIRNFLSRMRPAGACAAGACSPRASAPRASCFRLPNGTMVCPTK